MPVLAAQLVAGSVGGERVDPGVAVSSQQGLA